MVSESIVITTTPFIIFRANGKMDICVMNESSNFTHSIKPRETSWNRECE
ncbi:MAG: hypothetical protein QW372_06840 [Nitrososphaerales archaeon]